MNRVGLCGIPSLWMTREELINNQLIPKQALDEEERIARIHKIIKTHKKWETDRYLAASYKRGSQAMYQMYNNS